MATLQICDAHRVPHGIDARSASAAPAIRLQNAVSNEPVRQHLFRPALGSALD